MGVEDRLILKIMILKYSSFFFFQCKDGVTYKISFVVQSFSCLFVLEEALQYNSESNRAYIFNSTVEEEF